MGKSFQVEVTVVQQKKEGDNESDKKEGYIY